MACVYASGMQALSEHYKALLGLNKSWRVVKVDMELEPPEVKIHLKSTGAEAICSECGDACPLKDHAPERQWRHLDTMQFTTTIVARIPRTKCARRGVRTCNVPWADPHARFTLMFEAFAVQVRRLPRRHPLQADRLPAVRWRAPGRFQRAASASGLGTSGDPAQYQPASPMADLESKPRRPGHSPPANPRIGREAGGRWPMRCTHPSEMHGRTIQRSAAGVERRSPADSRGRRLSW